MLELAILWFLMTNSVAPVPTWCWVFWWIILIVKGINFIAQCIKIGMEMK